MQNFILLFLFTLTLIACGQTAKQDNAIFQSKDIIIEFKKEDKMDKQEFWKIMDYSFEKSQQDKSAQQDIIISKLVTYTPEQIIDFETILRQTLNEADNFKVMAAEKIIQGWVTDDPYLYFRCWLIGQGEKTFNETIKNPDFLADIVDKETYCNFEDLLYVTTEAFKQRTGKKEEDESFPREIAAGRNEQLDYDFGAPPTKGENWKANQLPKLYPKLWAKFH